MKIISWNINSIRLRLEMVIHFLNHHQPDVLCLQETKTVDDHFPQKAFIEAGYPHLAFRGMKSYNGVAIISKHPFTQKFHLDFVNKTDCRHIAVGFANHIELHNFYVPAGGDIPDRDENPKFAHKLDFVDEMGAWFPQNRNQDHQLVLVGDLNIAPLPEDVWSHRQLRNVVSHTSVEIEKFTHAQNSFSWIDATRHFHPPFDADGQAQKLYSWWSYRARDWRISNRGRRLDHIWVSPNLLEKLQAAEIYPDLRSAERPSDHVPISVELAA